MIKPLFNYNKAIEIDPGDAMAYFNRAIVYNTLEQYNKALRDYSKAIELDLEYSNAYYNRGFLYFVKLDRKAEACMDWEKACTLGECKNYNIAKSDGICK